MRPKKDNPWTILLIAIPFLAGGILLVLKTEPGIVRSSPAKYSQGFYVGVASVSMEHAAGIFGLIVTGLIVWVYFKVRDD